MLHIGLQFFAHKKGVGSTRNGRDSMAQRLGVESGATAWQVRSGRQHSGPSARSSATFILALTWASARHRQDISLFALKDGRVKFERLGKDRKAGLHRGGCRGVIFPCISPERTAVRGF